MKNSDDTNKAVELSSEDRQYNDNRSEDLSTGKSIRELRKKYIGVHESDNVKHVNELNVESTNVEVKLLKRKYSNQDADVSLPDRTIILEDGKIIGEQG